MAKLEELKRGATVKGILPDCLVTVIDVKWYGSAAIELTYKDPAGKPDVVLLYRDREPPLEIGQTRRLSSFDGDGELYRLVSEEHRIHLAHLFDPLKDRLPKEIRYWDHQANQLKDEELAGKVNAKINSGKARQRADELETRLQRRMLDLEFERQISPQPPVAIGDALIVPIGFSTSCTRHREPRMPTKRRRRKPASRWNCSPCRW